MVETGQDQIVVERFQAGMPYTFALEMRCDKEIGEGKAPLTENYLGELQQKVDDIRKRGGQVISVVSGNVLDPKTNVNTAANIFQVIGHKDPPPVQVVLPGIEVGRKTKTIGHEATVNVPGIILSQGLFIERTLDTRKKLNAVPKDTWIKEMIGFLENQDGILRGVVQGRTLDLDTGTIDIRGFALIE